jgi:hypothetical protein
MAQTDTRHYRDKQAHQLRLLIILLQEVNRIAPQVREDLLQKTSECQGEVELRLAAQRWASDWRLCDSEGPCSWAVTVGMDTALQCPEFGWNITGLLTILPASEAEPTEEDGEKVQNDLGFSISWPAGTLQWNPAKESEQDFRQRLLSCLNDEVDEQITSASDAHLGASTKIRQWKDTHVFTWLVRYLALGEGFDAIAAAPVKYRSSGYKGTVAPSGVRRDANILATELGLDLRLEIGRPKGRRDRIAHRHIAKK